MISDWRGVLSAVCRGKVNKKRRRRASSKGWHKTGGAYERQKLKGFENFREVPARQIDAAVSRPWAPDGADFSARIWKQKKDLINNLQTDITRALMTGETTTDLVEKISKRFNTTYGQAYRLVETETAYIQERAMLDTYDALDIEKYEICAVLDSKTSETCQHLDGKIFDKKDAKPGVTMPPFHCHCRTTTIPYIEGVTDDGERVARDPATGKSVRVENMTYEEWKATYVKPEGEYLKAEQSKVRRPTEADMQARDEKGRLLYDAKYLVNTKVVNAKDFRDKFDSMPLHGAARDALHKESVHILNETNGTPYEIVSALDARTGVLLARSAGTGELRSGFTKEQFDAIKAAGKKIVLLHNHPEGGRFSWTDIKTCFRHEMIDASVVVGHDGSVRVMREFNRKINIESLYKRMYNDIKKDYPLKSMAENMTLDEIYRAGVFVYEDDK